MSLRLKNTKERRRYNLDDLVELDENSTLLEWFDEWERLKVTASNLEDGTKKKYHVYRGVIEKMFGKDKLTKISARYYQEQFNTFCEGVGSDYAKRVNNVVAKVVAFAKDDGIKMRDFTQSLDVFAKRAKKSRDKKYLHSIRDYEIVLERCKAKFSYEKSVTAYYVYLMFLTGLRPAEMLSIKWHNIDFIHGTLYTEDRINTCNMERIGPKNATSIRRIPIDQTTKEVLLELREKQKDLLKRRYMTNPEDLIFLHWNYEGMLPTNATATKLMREVLNELKIKPVLTPYGARHTRISVLIANDIPLDVIARYVGHASTKQIIDTYGGLLKEKEVEGFDQIRQL
jgi:integrase